MTLLIKRIDEIQRRSVSPRQQQAINKDMERKADIGDMKKKDKGACPKCGDDKKQTTVQVKETESSLKIMKDCKNCGLEYAYFVEK